MTKNSKFTKNTIEEITAFNSFINQLKSHKKYLEKIRSEKKQYLINKTISNNDDSKNQINVDVSQKNDELVSTINEHDILLTAVNRNDMRIEINDWKNKELKLELKLLELITEMPNIILLMTHN